MAKSQAASKKTEKSEKPEVTEKPKKSGKYRNFVKAEQTDA